MKTYKGIELFKAVANYELKSGTKLKCIHYPIYGQGIEIDEREQRLIWSDTKNPIDYTHFNDRDFEFEIIEEEKEIEELSNYAVYDENTGLACGWSFQEGILKEKINELVRNVNEIKKEINK